jgi:hypothetical protein
MSRSLLLQGTADAWLDVIHAAICSREQAFLVFQAADAWLDASQPYIAEARISQYHTPVLR